MLRTRVGYAGGRAEAPTYRSIGDHTEAIEIDFDPAVTSFEELAGLFWRSHNPCSRSWSRQYANLLFVHDAAQRAVAERAREAITLDRNGELVRTRVVEMDSTRFWPAEDYHQKYYLRDTALGASVRAEFDSEAAFRDSTLAMRANAFVGGDLDRDAFERELAALGYDLAADGRSVRARAAGSPR